jgi:hypothetical protein
MSGEVYSNGLLSASPLKTVLDEEQKANDLSATQEPVISSLAAHVRMCWQYARDAKMQTIEPRMLFSVRARRGEYEPDKIAQIRDQGGSEIYAMLTSVKCRSAGSWIRDVLMGQGSEKPWTLKPSLVPELPPQIAEQVVQQAAQPIQQAMMSGQQISDAQIIQMMGPMRDAALEQLRDQARQMSHRMEDKMEDQLCEGGWLSALDAFIDDITTFPAAIIKGPVVRNKPVLKWMHDATGQWTPQVTNELKLEWERVDPFMIYPAPSATTVDDGYLIEKHRMQRQDLQDLIGVDGYNDDEIKAVLEDYGRGGLREWLTNDVAQASAEGKATTSVGLNPDGLIDAIEFWGSVQGQALLDWGMKEKDIDDPTKEYHVNVWVVGTHVIKAMLNPDPLRRKPYYKTSYEDIPGSFWGNSVADLVRDAQTVCNAAARAIVNNMGIASGPQVVVNIDRLPAGEDISQMTPWKIWQVTNDPMGGSAPPVEFNQPDSRVAELMQIFQAFSTMADEYSGIPRYMAGDASGNAGRTASGLSMLMGNAGKSIKQVISNIDTEVMTPLLERLYYYNMRYSNDASLKGDVNIIARGANSLIAKDAAQLRRNEFLQATANPIDMQIVGLSGRAAILRENAKALDMDPDKIVPPPEVVAARQAAAQAMQQQAAQGGQPGQPSPGGGQPGTPGQNVGSLPNPQANGQTLTNGAPITDNFSPR